MEINIQMKKVQKPEDVITAFAALGQGQSLAGRNRPPIQRAVRFGTVGIACGFLR